MKLYKLSFLFQNCCVSSKIVVLFYVLFILYCSMYCLCINVYCHLVTTQLQLTNISYHIKNKKDTNYLFDEAVTVY